MKDLKLENKDNLDSAFKNRMKYMADRPRLTLEMVDKMLEEFGLEVIIAWENRSQVVFKINKRE